MKSQRPDLLAALLLPMLLLALSPQAQADLLLVYSVQRHGARNLLPKNSTLAEPESGGGPTLLPEGQRQCYNAGAAFRSRYITNPSCSTNSTCLSSTTTNGVTATEYGVFGNPNVGFHHYNSIMRSSGLSRTLMSAESFLAGVFPPSDRPTNTTYLPNGQEVIPVYSNIDAEDMLIRAYTKCPTYQAILDEWFVSDEFTTKAKETEAFRNRIAAVTPNLDVKLQNWWNVYDAFNVWRTYKVGDPTPNIDADDYAQMVTLAYWLETSKMRSVFTGSLLGGPLLGDLLTRLSAAYNASSKGSQNYMRLLTVSTHYNTQLGLLSALAVDQYPPAADTVPWITKKIPSTAAVLAFELHGPPASFDAPDATKYAVRAVAQDGPGPEGNNPYFNIPLPCAQAGDVAESLAGPGACTLAAFMAYAGPRALNTSDAWCQACNNNSTQTCQAVQTRNALALVDGGAGAGGSSGNAVGSSSGGNSVAVWVPVVVVICGFLAGSLVALAVVWGLNRRRGGSGLQQKASVEDGLTQSAI